MNIWVIVAIVAVVGIVFALISTYNSFIRARNKVEEAFATMDVYLKQRWDLIPNLVSTVKGYAKHEEGVLKDIVELRNGTTYGNQSMEDKVELNNKLNAKINGLLALAENYPELKANENFRDLGDKLTHVEKDIANSRKYYNAVVLDYNNRITVFPSNMIAKMFGFIKATMFETAENERNNVEVKF